MKQLLWGSVLAALVAACGGGAKPAPTEPQPPAKSACALAAENVANELIAAGADDLKEEHRAGLLRVITERCETDRWSDEAVSCLTTAKAMDEGFKRCGEMLTEAQEEAAEGQLNREVMPNRGERGAEAGERAPVEEPKKAMPPPAPPPPDDPCGGGA